MKDYCEVIDPGTIRIEKLLPGPVERVWEFLTAAEKRSKWFCGGDMELKEGGKFEMKFNNSNLSDNEVVPEKYKKYDKGVTYKGTITKCQPPNLLVYLWHDEDDEDSEVSIELKEIDDKVSLVLTHTKITNRGTLVGASSGWHAHLDLLVDAILGVEPRGFWNNFTLLEAEYEERIPE